MKELSPRSPLYFRIYCDSEFDCDFIREHKSKNTRKLHHQKQFYTTIMKNQNYLKFLDLVVIDAYEETVTTGLQNKRKN